MTYIDINTPRNFHELLMSAYLESTSINTAEYFRRFRSYSGFCGQRLIATRPVRRKTLRERAFIALCVSIHREIKTNPQIIFQIHDIMIPIEINAPKTWIYYFNLLLSSPVLRNSTSIVQKNIIKKSISIYDRALSELRIPQASTSIPETWKCYGPSGTRANMIF